MPVIEDATLDQLMEAVGDSVSQGLSVSEAVDELLPAMPISPEIQTIMTRIGLIQFVHDRLHNWRRARNDNERWSFQSRFMVRPLTGANARADILRRILLEGAEGYTKSLMAFTVSDCTRFMEVAQGQIDGWSKKRAAIATMADALSLAQVETVGDLPIETINRVADAIGEAWTA